MIFIGKSSIPIKPKVFSRKKRPDCPDGAGIDRDITTMTIRTVEISIAVVNWKIISNALRWPIKIENSWQKVSPRIR